MTLKRRIEKLERVNGGTSDKHYLFVIGKQGEPKEDAISRTLKEKGITESDVGLMFVMGKNYCFEKDYKGYRDKHDLQGWHEGDRRLRNILESLPSTVGPPSQRANSRNK